MPPSIKRLADNYQEQYGFMALNATYHNQQLLHRVHFHHEDSLIEQIRKELEDRGVSLVRTKEEYDALVEQHGLPPFFKTDSVAT